MCPAARLAAISRSLSRAAIRRDPAKVDWRGEGVRACIRPFVNFKVERLRLSGKPDVGLNGNPCARPLDWLP